LKNVKTSRVEVELTTTTATTTTAASSSLLSPLSLRPLTDRRPQRAADSHALDDPVETAVVSGHCLQVD